MATKKIPTAIATPAAIAQEIVAAAENSNNAITAKQNPTTPSLSLPAGQTTQTTFNINSFDPRFPTGFVTMVTDKNDNPVGYVKDGKVVPLLEPGYSLAEVEAQRNAKNPKPNPQLEATASAQAGSFNYAQTLQETAKAEYNQMVATATIVSRGEASPSQKAELESLAKEYASTMSAIKTAYQKSNAVNGPINLDLKTGSLAANTTYTEPTSGQQMTVTPKGAVASPDQSGVVGGTKELPALSNTGSTASAANKSTVANNSTTANTGSTQTFGVTGGTGSTESTGSTNNTGLGKAPVTSSNNYTTSKGILSYNDNPFTGEYQGKYYANGKLETADQIKSDFMAKYGEQAKFIASVPELSNLLSTAIASNWSATQWTTQFANTQWAQQHPGDIGLAEIKRISTPSQYNTDYNAAQNRIAGIAESFGMKLTPQQLGAQVADINTTPTLDQNAVNSGQDLTNWLMQHPTATDAQITQQMAKYGTIDPATGPGGAVKQFSNNIQALAQQYGVLGQFSPDGKSTNFDNYAIQQAASGANLSDPSVIATAEQMYKTAAVNTYKPFADQINAGMKVSDLASPYVNTLSNLLEVSPSDINLGSSSGYGAMISKAMMGDANGQVTNPYDFANQVRSQPEWLNTQNAHQTILGGVNQLISKMGF
jgi:hypothetical protein